MRKFLITLVTAGSALAFAAPASAQYFPAPQGYAYGNPYGNYGYNPDTGRRVHALNRQVERLNSRIQQLGRAGALSTWEARQLADEARGIAYRLDRSARNGLSMREQRAVELRLARLEQRIRREARDFNGRRGNDWQNRGGWDNGYDQMGPDRDRDGRDDRWEDDRGNRRDR